MTTNVRDLRKWKSEGTRFTMLTCYDYSTARWLDRAGVPVLLVGDSLGTTMLGYPDTLSVTMDDMIRHAGAVVRGAPGALVIGDMPFMAYHASAEDAIRNAGRFLQEARVSAVKLEGGGRVIDERVRTGANRCLRRVVVDGHRVAGGSRGIRRGIDGASGDRYRAVRHRR